MRCVWRRNRACSSHRPRWLPWNPRLDPAGRPQRLLVNFFGLFGPDGPLPLHLTEYARDRRRNFRDPTLQRFADIFHHRALSLLWRAWADSAAHAEFRPAGRGSLRRSMSGALCGLGMESLRDRDAMPHLTKLHFAGRISRTRPVTPKGLRPFCHCFSPWRVRVASCFIGAWLTLPDLRPHRVWATRPQHGHAGRRRPWWVARVWSQAAEIPHRHGAGGDSRLCAPAAGRRRACTSLIPIVRNYAGDVPLWDVNLILKRDEVPPIRLGPSGTAWLVYLADAAPACETDAADLFLDASADSMGAPDRSPKRIAGKNPFEEEVTHDGDQPHRAVR